MEKPLGTISKMVSVGLMGGGKKMPEQENLKKYMLLGSESTTSLKEFIKHEILIILLSIPITVFNIIQKKYFFLCLSILPTGIHLLSAVKLMSGRKIEGIRDLLYSGIGLCCMSFIFGLSGIEILIYLLFEGKERIIILCIVSAGYVLMLKLYEHIVRKHINKTSDNSKRSGIWMPFTLCGALGMAVARPFAKTADNRTMLIVILVGCMLLSYLFLMGIVFLYKYIFIVNHKEIFSEKM